MAVQAQYPSASLLHHYRSRVHSIDNRDRDTATGALAAELQSPAATAANLFRVTNNVAGMNFLQHPIFNVETGPNETANDFLGNLSKRPRECEDMLNKQHAFIPTTGCERQGSPSPFLVSQPPRISTGLRLSLDDSRMTSPSPASTSGRGNAAASLLSILSENLQSEMLMQKEEIEQLIKIQGDRMKQALEEKRKRHARAFLSAIEEGLNKRLKSKDAELEKVTRRNMELEERVRQLSMESQLWQNVAKNSELLASNLRNSLEQVVAQSREHSREGCGESEVDDAESCQFGEGGDVHARTCKENKELKEQRTCRMCRTNSVCILLLPCRHLCLCKDCEGRRDVCPLCGTAKNASVQVYMS